MNAPAKPFTKWVGGKRQLIDEMLKYVPEKIELYVEPFIGGGALFWELANQKRFKRAVINDANLRLMRTYRAIQNDVEKVISELKRHVYDHDWFEEVRKDNPDAMDDVGCAVWFIYLNRTCFNGLYRVNKKGQFNVPFGRYTNPTICDEDTLLSCSMALRNVEIEHGDFHSVLQKQTWTGRSFVYMDCPYVPLSASSNFASYTADGFDDTDQVRLRDVAAKLRKVKRMSVLLSNSSAPRVYELYKEFDIIEIDARRAVNSKASARGAVKELLIR